MRLNSLNLLCLIIKRLYTVLKKKIILWKLKKKKKKKKFLIVNKKKFSVKKLFLVLSK
jgi:hypothetical protein